jgi:YHS domain-containing protein
MKKYLFAVISIFLCSLAHSQVDAVRQKHFNVKQNLALEGYDVVSYFENKPEEGSEKNSLQSKGITYHFKSADNLSKFKASPEKYEPMYGGLVRICDG